MNGKANQSKFHFAPLPIFGAASRTIAVVIAALAIAGVACSGTDAIDNFDQVGSTASALTATFQSTHKVCQLTGDTDLGTAGSAGSTTGMVRGGGAQGITGTDIGWSFDFGGRLNFMFGDTRDFDRNRCDPGACGVLNHHISVSPTEIADWTDWTGTNPQDLSNPNMYEDWLDTHGDSAESWASAPTGSDPSVCLPLQVAMDSTTSTHRLTTLNGRTLPRQEGFFSGFTDGSSNLFAFTTQKSWPTGCTAASGCAHDDASPGGKTALAISRDGGTTFDELFNFSTTHFQFVAPTVMSGSAYAQLPSGLSAKNVLFAFGAGRTITGSNSMSPWNTSYPYLAVSDVATVTSKAPTVDGVTAFVHKVTWNPNNVANPVGLTGPAIGLAPEDKRILPYNEKALVVRSDGYVWYQTIGLNGVGPYVELPPRVQSNGYVPLVATNPTDKWVVPDPKRNRLLVIETNGNVFVHPVTDHIEAPYQLTTLAPVAARPEDNWVLVVGDRIIVITKRGLVYGHPITGTGGNTIGAATMLSNPSDTTTYVAGTTPPSTPVEKWVFALDNNVMTVTGQGAVFSHAIAPVHINGQPDVGPPQSFTGYPQVGWSDNDRWLVPIHATSGDELLLDITYKPTSFSYFAGLNGSSQPTWTSDQASAWPLWTDSHQCLGYYSVRYVPAANTWLALYTCNVPGVQRAIYLRTATNPWGPWSSGVAVMMAPGTELPYCNYMHLPTDLGACAEGSLNPFEDEKRVAQGQPRAGMRNVGGEYAPFLLPGNYQHYTAGGTSTLYFTLSTWNPYQTVLMATNVTLQ